MRLQSNDGLLVERFQGGGADAGRALVHEQYPRIYRYLLGLT